MVPLEPGLDFGYELQIIKTIDADEKLFFIGTAGL